MVRNGMPSHKSVGRLRSSFRQPKNQERNRLGMTAIHNQFLFSGYERILDNNLEIKYIAAIEAKKIHHHILFLGIPRRVSSLDILFM